MEYFHSRRSTVYAIKGVCCSSQSIASGVGVKILQAGGSAADAAVAMAATLNIIEPCSTGIGGDAFALYYEADSKRVHCLQGNGCSAADFTLEVLKSKGFAHDLKPLPQHSGLCVTVPGAAALWDDLVTTYGSLSMQQVLQPAIDLAEQGVPIGQVTAEAWNKAFIQGDEAHRVLKPNGLPIKPGQVFKNQDLAATFKAVATHGAHRGFYQGRVAESIVEAVREFGGVLSLDDLKSHRTVVEDEPISTVYKGLRIYQTPPPSHGLAVLLALNILSALEEMQATGEKPGYQADASYPTPLATRYSAEHTHVLVEVMRRAYADAVHFIGDPHHASSANMPLSYLLSSEYATSRAKEISLSQSTPVLPITPTSDLAFWEHYNETLRTYFNASDTVYLCVADAKGNVCSFINSNYMSFGTGIMPRGCGFTLQNRGFNFTLMPTHMNCAAGRKRPYHTIIPGMAVHEADGSFYAAFGNMGGFFQPMGHLQIIRGLVDYGMDPQLVVDAARWTLKGLGKSHTAHDLLASHIELEEGYNKYNPNIHLELGAMGHQVHPAYTHGMDKNIYGKAQVIVYDREQGVYVAGSDPRGDGCAVPAL
eukprot:gene28243-34107_t